MSVIKITVDEQNLHITDSPKIAAQGVNENYVEFTFSEDWTGFSKVALFYREKDEDTVYQSLIDGTNKALVPHEVTDQDGKICIGVAGLKDDVIHTSEILKYKIVKGRYATGESSEPPTPGIYEQILTIAEHLNDLTENTPYLFYEENEDFELPVHTINDNETSDQSTWSSEKISNDFVAKRQLRVGYRDPGYDLRIEDDIEISIGTVTANAYVKKQQNIYIDGYVPFSILRLMPLNGTSDDGSLNLVNFGLFNISSTGAYIDVGIKNNTSNALTEAKCRAIILYVRKEFFQ